MRGVVVQNRGGVQWAKWRGATARESLRGYRRLLIPGALQLDCGRLIQQALRLVKDIRPEHFMNHRRLEEGLLYRSHPDEFVHDPIGPVSRRFIGAIPREDQEIR